MNTEHLIHLTNSVGCMAATCVMRIKTDKREVAVKLAQERGHSSFIVIRRCDSPDGFSDQMVARVVNGQLQ